LAKPRFPSLYHGNIFFSGKLSTVQPFTYTDLIYVHKNIEDGDKFGGIKSSSGMNIS